MEFKLDWTQAVVNDGDLVVPVVGGDDDRWAAFAMAFAETLDASLSRSRKLHLHRRVIAIEGVSKGAEDELAAHLDEQVALANRRSHERAQARHAAEEQERASAADHASEDASMTERFRHHSAG
jgi:hypothetical protein